RLTQLRVDANRLHFEAQLLAAADRPVEADVHVLFAAIEAADEIVELPDHPVGCVTRVETGVHVERIVQEIRGRDLERVAEAFVALDAAAVDTAFDLVGPVAFAGPLIVEVGVDAGRDVHDAVTARYEIVDRRTVHVDLCVLVAAVAQAALPAH